MGTRRTAFRHRRHLVPARRRPLHRLHLRRRAGARVRQGRHRLLRRALHVAHFPDRVRGVYASVVGLTPQGLRHRRGFRARSLRFALARRIGRNHRHPRHHALHRPATRRHRGRRRRPRLHDARLARRHAACHRLRRARRLHLHQRSARACPDRHRQGRAHLHYRADGRHRDSAAHGRLRRNLREDSGQDALPCGPFTAISAP